MTRLIALLLLILSALQVHGAEYDITDKFSGCWNETETAVHNSDGSITYHSASWGGLSAWYGSVDWSSYDKLVFEFAASTTVNTQIYIIGNEDIRVWGDVGITSLECSFSGKDLSDVSQLALQTSDPSTIVVKRVYLVRSNNGGNTNYNPWQRITDSEGYETSWSAVSNMRIGWNLGNTLDSNSGDTSNMWIEMWSDRSPSAYETAWGQPLATRELIHMLKESGFNAIRVPVTWYPHYGNVIVNNLTWDKSTWTGYDINSAWMSRVKEVVDYVLAEGMYCILNVHHDTGASTTAWLVADETTYQNTKYRFETLWTKIATEFKDYGDRLLFEGYNEMLDPYNSWCFSSFGTSNGYDESVANSAYRAINKYAQSFVNTVRSTGGNNSNRNLIVCTYGACCGEGSWNSHLSEPLTNMQKPSDTVEDHIIFEVHSYPDISDLNYVKSNINTMLTRLDNYLIKKGAPVIFGEWGPSDSNEDAYHTLHDNLLSFASYFVEQAKALGIGTFYWMGLTDGNDRSVPRWSQEDLKEAIVRGYYGEAGYIPTLKGDVTHDGVLNIFDINALVNIIKKRDLPEFGYDYDAADVNSDGTMDIMDVSKLINLIRGR